MISELNTCSIPSFRAMVDCKAASAVKRCLFGEPDHAHVRAELVKQLSQIIQQDSEKYNFDFVNGRPLEGRFEWEKVEPAESAETTNDPPADLAERLHLSRSDIVTPEKKVSQRCSKSKTRTCKSKSEGRQLTLTGKRALASYFCWLSKICLLSIEC